MLAVASCSPFGEVTEQDREWVQDYASASRLEPSAAAEKLAALAENAPNDDKRRDALFDRARVLVDAGEIEDARRQFRALHEEDIDDNVSSRALYELGRIAAEHDEDFEQARRLLRQAIVDTSPWAGAELSMQFLIRLEQRLDRHEPLVALLDEISRQLDDDRIASQLHLERGLLLDDQLGRADAALQAFRDAFSRCSDCAAADEAVYQMAQIYVRHQRWQPAVDALEIIANRSRQSWFVGTYSSQRASDARFQLGRIELLYRNDYDAARDHFETFVDRFEHHSNTDDAAWHLVTIERLDGTARSYRRALQRFIDDYPHSRYVDEAKAELAEES